MLMICGWLLNDPFRRSPLAAQVEEVMGVLASSLDEATEAGCRVTVVVFTGVFDMESF